LAVAFVFLGAPGPGRAQESLLERDVLPVLTRQCLGCHGGLRQKGKLDLRTVPAMLRGGRSGPAIKARDAGGSELWKRVAADEMPPGGKKLSASEKQLLKRWIADGLPTVAERLKEGPLLEPGRKHAPKQVADAIDRHLNQALAARKLKAVPRSDDAEFLRRAYLDLTGRVPTAEQAKAFLDGKAADKRAKLIDDLLATPQFGEQFGRTWRDWICPPELPSDGNGGAQPHAQAQELGRWLGRRFAAGDRWDQITRDVLAVEGETRIKPQVIFFGLVGEGGRVTADGSARAVASLFMGVQLRCAQCHDDPYRDWAQREHWALAAFFAKTTGDFNKVSEPVAPVSPGGKGPPATGAARITIPRSAFKNAGTAVQAAFLGGKSFDAGANEALRPHLVAWLTAKDNPYFAPAFANRTWSYFFARGLVNPVDDIRPLNPPAHPGLMKLLANEFRDSGFDVKHLIRCICNSEAYQRTSHVAPDLDEPAVAALTEAYGRMPLRVMTADVLYDSLKQAYGEPKLDLRADDSKGSSTAGMSAPVADAYLEFLRRFGTNKEDSTDFTHGIPQMLTMINHPRLLAGSKALDAFRKRRPAPSPEETVEWLYLSTLSRRPTAPEQAEAQRYLRRSKDQAKAYAGVLWMLVNRSEYLLVR
jgi:hypothetical protein